MNHRFKVLNIALVAGHQAPKVLQPRICPFDDPSALVASMLSPVLMCRHSVVLPPRDDRLDLTLDQQRSRRVAVIGAVCNQPLRLMWATALTAATFHFDAIERLFEKFDFRGGSLLHAKSSRSTLAICQYHKLRPLAAFGLAHTVAPFFATTNMPSTKHSFQRILRASLSWSRKARHKFKRAPLSAHSERRRWTALLEPYLSGSSLHGAPVQRIHSMPSKHWRSLSGGRPPRLFSLRLGSWASINSHCLSVTARQAIEYLHGLVSYRIKTTCQPV